MKLLIVEAGGTCRYHKTLNLNINPLKFKGLMCSLSGRGNYLFTLLLSINNENGQRSLYFYAPRMKDKFFILLFFLWTMNVFVLFVPVSF